MHARTRRKALAKIHVGRKLLGLDEETYRQILERATGSRSAGDLDAAGLSKALDEMARLGAFGKPARVRPRPDERRRPLLGKIYRLLDGRGPEYAEGILRHMFGDSAPERLEWATREQLRKVVAALEYDRKRRAKKARAAGAGR